MTAAQPWMKYRHPSSTRRPRVCACRCAWCKNSSSPRGDRISRERQEAAVAFGSARCLTAQLGVFVDRVEQVATRLEHVDLVCADQAAQLVVITLDALHNFAVARALRVDRQVAAHELDVA